MKKMFYLLISFFIIPTFVSAVSNPSVKTLDVTVKDQTISYTGTMEDGASAVMCKLYHNNEEVDKLSSAVDNHTFKGSFTVTDGGDYTVYCANYEGGAILSKEVKVTSAATVIKEVNVTLDAPVIGDKVTVKEVDFGGYGGYEQDNKPNVTASDNANYTIDDAAWIKGTYKEVGDDFEEYFSGTFEKDKYYYAVIYISAKGGYTLDSDVSIKVNGEAPAEVFAVFNHGESTFFIAKIKSQNAPTTIKTVDSKVSATFKDGETEGYELSVKEIEVSKDLSKKGVKTVFDINVLKDDKIVKISDREVSVTIDLDESLQGFKYYKVAYIEDGKIKEELPATVKDGKLTFTTTHFSEYGIIASNTEIKPPKTGDHIMQYVGFAMVGFIGLTASIVILKKRKN